MKEVLMTKYYAFFLLALSLISCQMMGEDDDLRTVPITNNPHIVPNYGSTGGIPMPAKAH